MVEEVRAEQPGPRRDLGDGGLGGRRLEAAGAATVDEVERGHLAHRGDGLGATLRELGHRAPLHRADGEATQPGLVVADTGDLALVGHEPDEAEPWVVVDRPGQGGDLLRGVRGRAARPEVHPAPGQPQRRVELDAHPHRWAVDPDVGGGEVEVLRAVDHEGHPGGQALVGPEPGERRAVDAGVPDDDVLDLLGEPQRLGQGVGEDPGVPGGRQGAPHDLAAPHRLARDPDRGAAGPPDEVGGVRAQRGEVDDGEGGLEVRGGTGEGVVVDGAGARVAAHGPSTRSR